MNITSMALPELEELLGGSNYNQPRFRAKQIYEWLHKKNVTSFDDMTNIALELRNRLSADFVIENIREVKNLKSENTTKYLFEIDKNNIIESVLMKYDYGNTVCISTQAGCRMGCTFCHSAVGGFSRNLTVGEMLSQVYNINKSDKVSRVVLMGSGEPLDNYDNVLAFIKILNSKEGLNISQRNITLSTCGLIDQIYLLAENNLQITLAVSLHAPNDKIRKSLMPVAKKYTIDDLLDACKKYANKTKRRVTFEYAMIKGINDSKENAYELAKKIKHTLCHVNIIPVNEARDKNFLRSTPESITEFSDILCSYGIDTTVRKKLGSDINAACGQLKAIYIDTVNSNKP